MVTSQSWGFPAASYSIWGLACCVLLPDSASRPGRAQNLRYFLFGIS
jgi:hypothetical protein